VGDVAHPRRLGSAVGVYRFWRDGGYAVGALVAGFLADLFGMAPAIGAVAALAFLSGVQVAWRMPETLHRPRARSAREARDADTPDHPRPAVGDRAGARRSTLDELTAWTLRADRVLVF